MLDEQVNQHDIAIEKLMSKEESEDDKPEKPVKLVASVSDEQIKALNSKLAMIE